MRTPAEEVKGDAKRIVETHDLLHFRNISPHLVPRELFVLHASTGTGTFRVL